MKAFLNFEIRQGAFLSIFALACGGNVVTGEPGDAGNDVSQAGAGGGTVATSTAVTSGSGTSVSTATGSAGSPGTGGAGGAGGGTDWGACGGPGECTVQYNGCCEACVVANIGDFVGVNAKSVQQFRQQICPFPPPCDPCIPAPKPFFGARCTNGRCEVFDVRQVPEFSKCGVDGDCRLRKGLDCCECGAPGEWTAVSNSGEAPLSQAVCAPMTACDDCAPTPPPGLKAVCTMNHCDLAAIK
jgi:hypothetical protein